MRVLGVVNGSSGCGCCVKGETAYIRVKEDTGAGRRSRSQSRSRSRSRSGDRRRN